MPRRPLRLPQDALSSPDPSLPPSGLGRRRRARPSASQDDVPVSPRETSAPVAPGRLVDQPVTRASGQVSTIPGHANESTQIGGRGHFPQSNHGAGGPPVLPRADEVAAKVRIAKSSEPPSPPPTRVERGRLAWENLVRVARSDPNTFCELVLRSDKRTETEHHDAVERVASGSGDISGPPIRQHRIHEEMHAALTESRHIVVMGHPESGKSVQLGQGRVLWSLGRDVGSHYALVGNTQSGAKKTLEPIKQYIERSVELRAVFPRLRPGSLWTTEAITVERSTASRDPSVQTVGFHGDIQGARLEGIVADDLLDYENTKTEPMRQDVTRWFKMSVLSREAHGAWCAFLTNAWHERDTAHELEREGWRTLRYPVRDEEGVPTWSELWPPDRIADAERIHGPLDFARLFMCRPRDDASRVFVAEAIERCLERGRGYGLVDELPEGLVDRPDFLVVHGVDIGASRRLRGGETVFFSIGIHPNRDRQVLSIRSSRRGTRWMLETLADLALRFGGIFVVEDNGVQKMIVEVAAETGDELDATIVPFQTGRNKYDPNNGIAAMAAEFDRGRWILPAESHPQMTRYVGELESYDPLAHTGDRLMASWMARTYAVRLMRGREGRLRGGVGAQSIGPSRSQVVDVGAIERVATEALDPVERAHALLELERLRRREEARARAVTLEDLGL